MCHGVASDWNTESADFYLLDDFFLSSPIDVNFSESKKRVAGAFKQMTSRWTNKKKKIEKFRENHIKRKETEATGDFKVTRRARHKN